ncbi:MAG: sugar phosphate isomerase/epimerase [Clostridiales Family XIII bacterium]|jgi:sugar phosphate isomerase/epimerase|nr:sugar phosphate isomerase/epimerase [Clostridiales Family XIII bacterium]
MAKKVSIGSWAYAFLATPILLPETCKKLGDLKFDGISMGGFVPHAAPKDWDTDEKRAELAKLLSDNGLEVADYAVDLWSVDAITDPDAWIALFKESSDFASKMGWKHIRVDTGRKDVSVPEGWTYAQVRDQVVKNFKTIAQYAAQYGQEVVWEFEPGFVVNEPKYIAEVYDRVAEPNFSVLFDTCHGHMCASGANHIEPAPLEGGVLEFIKMLKGKIGFVHVIDSDGTLNSDNTSTHAPFGEGFLNFDEIIPALLDAGYEGDWWAIDLCECPDAWEATADCKKFVDEQINAKY